MVLCLVTLISFVIDAVLWLFCGMTRRFSNVERLGINAFFLIDAFLVFGFKGGNRANDDEQCQVKRAAWREEFSSMLIKEKAGGGDASGLVGSFD